MGQKGRFNGEDIVDKICQQPATARFIARHMYDFFVADEPPVSQWPDTPPKDPEAIEILTQAYFRYDCDARSMLRVLFNSDFFKDAGFAKLKSPAEVVAGTLHLTKDFTLPKPGLVDMALQCQYMGQDLINPPSVEGWHTGTEWIDSGTLVERVNFVADRLGDTSRPGIRQIILRLASRGGRFSGDEFVNGCLEQLGCVEVDEETRQTLVEHALAAGEIRAEEEEFARRTVDMLQLIAAAKEYQFG